MVGRDFKSRQHTVESRPIGVDNARISCRKRDTHNTIVGGKLADVTPIRPLFTAWTGCYVEAGIDCGAAAHDATDSALFEHCGRTVVRLGETVDPM